MQMDRIGILWYYYPLPKTFIFLINVGKLTTFTQVIEIKKWIDLTSIIIHINDVLELQADS